MGRIGTPEEIRIWPFIWPQMNPLTLLVPSLIDGGMTI